MICEPCLYPEMGRSKDQPLSWGRWSSPRPAALWNPNITAVLCTVILNHWNSGLLVLSCEGQTVLWRLLSQGLLELKQACPAPDDLPDHEAG